MKGFVPTPESVVDLMVDKLFRVSPPVPGARLLDPGCGPGAFVDGVLRWCARNGVCPPNIVGVDSDPRHVHTARARFSACPAVEIRQADFLRDDMEGFDYVVGNPPYVALTGMSAAEKALYRRAFRSATGRFDLYLLFFERALNLLKPQGRLVFITPEKFIYVETAAPLREMLSAFKLEELHFLGEATFPGYVTYPVVTTVTAAQSDGRMSVVVRGGGRSDLPAPKSGGSWLPAVLGEDELPEGPTLANVAARISCGVATGADSVFTVLSASIPRPLRRFAHPTISGRQLGREEVPRTTHSLLIPYRGDGTLLAEAELGPLRDFLDAKDRRDRLDARTCSRRKPWYAFHETPQLRDILQPKILCKDITSAPAFVADRIGNIVPRHSVYYIIPRVGVDLDLLLEYLNSAVCHRWLASHCQRAANGYLRLQSAVLKKLPVPAMLVAGVLVAERRARVHRRSA